MALPENEEALNKMLEDARTNAATAAQAAALKVLEGTSFKSLEDLKNAQIEAAKKIGEQGTELGELRKKVKEPDAPQQTDDEVISSISEEEAEALALLYDKNKDIARQIDAGGKKAQAEAIKSLREVKPRGTPSNPFKKVEAKETKANLQKMIQDAVRAAERGSNRPTGSAGGDDSETVRTRSGMSGYFKK